MKHILFILMAITGGIVPVIHVENQPKIHILSG